MLKGLGLGEQAVIIHLRISVTTPQPPDLDLLSLVLPDITAPYAEMHGQRHEP